MVSTWNCTLSPLTTSGESLPGYLSGLKPCKNKENPNRGGLRFSWLVRDSNSRTVYDKQIQTSTNTCIQVYVAAIQYTSNHIWGHPNTDVQAHQTAHGITYDFTQTNLHESGFLDTNTNHPCIRNTPSLEAPGLSTPNEGAYCA